MKITVASLCFLLTTSAFAPQVDRKTLASILGVSFDADLQEIKMAYRNLAKIYHPDANPLEDTTEKFQELNRVYELLTKQFSVAAAVQKDTTTSFGQQIQSDTTYYHDPYYGIQIGQSPRFLHANRNRRGADLEVDLEIDITTAICGGQARLQIQHLEGCTSCKGQGVLPESALLTCPECQGSGTVAKIAGSKPLGAFQRQPCPTCRKLGRIEIDSDCIPCDGKGLVSARKEILVSIPANVARGGTTLRVGGEGNVGRMGGPAGDLYVRLMVKEEADKSPLPSIHEEREDRSPVRSHDHSLRRNRSAV